MVLWCTGISKCFYSSFHALLLTTTSGGAFLGCGSCSLSSLVLTCTCPDRTGLVDKESSIDLRPVGAGSGVFVTADGELSCRAGA
jgi:hypothetical protein